MFQGFHFYQCTKRASRDGYCGTHHPDAVAKRKAKRDAAYDAKCAQWKDNAERRAWERKAIEACAGMSDPAAEIASLRFDIDMQGQMLVDKDAAIEALRAERDALIGHVNACLEWIATSSDAQGWDSRTTPDFIVAATAAVCVAKP